MKFKSKNGKEYNLNKEKANEVENYVNGSSVLSERILNDFAVELGLEDTPLVLEMLSYCYEINECECCGIFSDDVERRYNNEMKCEDCYKDSLEEE